MKENNVKRVQDSLTEQVQIVLYTHTNATRRLFGGQLMLWIDTVATVAARRHSGCEVITAAVGNLSFLAPAYVGDTIVLRARVAYTGNTSMVVRVDTYRESSPGEKIPINQAYLIIVALDAEGNPCTIPALVLETEEERAIWQDAKRFKISRGRDEA